MNLQDLQENWGTQDTQSNLVLQLYRESRQNKVNDKLKRITLYSVLFMLFNLMVIIYAWLILVEYYASVALVIQALLLILLSKIVFYKNVLQLHWITKIKYTAPIIQTQKILEKLKIERIKHNRFIFIWSNLYFWLIIMLLFQWDITSLIQTIWVNAPIVVVIHVAMFLLWFPLSLWILRKHDATDKLSEFWKKMSNDSYLTDHSVNTSLNNAISYLQEIKAFEREEVIN